MEARFVDRVLKSDAAKESRAVAMLFILVYASPAFLPVFAMSPTAVATFVNVAARSKKPVLLTSFMIASASVENPSPALTAPSPMESITPFRLSRTFAKLSLMEAMQVPTASITVPIAVPMDSIRPPIAPIGSASAVDNPEKESTMVATLVPTLSTTPEMAVPIFSITPPMLSIIGPMDSRRPVKAVTISGSFETVVSTIFVISGIYGAMA